MSLTEISAADAARMVEKKHAIIVDVREAHEIARERIPGAMIKPLSTLGEEALPLPKKTKALFICHSGARTNSTAPKLARISGNRGHVVRGGMIAWKNTGLAVEVPNDPASKKARLVWNGSNFLLVAALGLSGAGLMSGQTMYGLAGMAAALAVFAMRGPVIASLIAKGTAQGGKKG
ncbi:MAG: hypothetical protein C0606_13700 [Hyphomicrobiales bacterium]|nr:MAG: hypothetical protein C0606_13700 [Hyphomicrobiales bacterium]